MSCIGVAKLGEEFCAAIAFDTDCYIVELPLTVTIRITNTVHKFGLSFSP